MISGFYDFSILFSSFLASCPLQTSSIFIFFIFPSPPRKKIRSNPTPLPAAPWGPWFRRPTWRRGSWLPPAARCPARCHDENPGWGWGCGWGSPEQHWETSLTGGQIGEILVTHVYRWWISFRMVDFSLKTSLNTALNETQVGKSIHFGFTHRVF